MNGSGAHADKLHYFTEAANLLLDAPLFYVSRKLIPNDYIDRTLVPDAVGRSYDEFLYGGTLFDCPPRTVCEVSTAFRVCFAVLELEREDGYAVLGPYWPEDAGAMPELRELLVMNGVPLSECEGYRAYFERLPVISRVRAHAMLTGLPLALYGWMPDPQPRSVTLDAAQQPCPVFEEDVTAARAQALEQRYESERRFMEAVERGDDSAVREMTIIRLDRLPNRLRNQKNLSFVLNTLLRKAAERAKVHPLYIDGISAKWAVRIENALTLAGLEPMQHEMIVDYCALVRKHSLARYSPNVRAAINYMHFHMSSPDLSLGEIAKNVGANASYLSHQFNQEVGMSVPEYIARLRVREAQNLLTGRAELQVGQIAAAVGFQDVNYFSRTFKRITGCTPTRYREGGHAIP